MTISALRYWIVDDDLGFGRSLKRMLNARGIPAEYFGSAQSFLESVPHDQSGYAVVDVHMPVCDGFGLMRKMRELRYGMPVIVITGHAGIEEQDRAIEEGAIGFLQKPFSEGSLMELVLKQEAKKSRS